MSDSLRPQGLYSPWNPPGQNTRVSSLSLTPGDLLNAGVKPRSPALQANSLPAEPQGKPKNTAVSSLSLLPGNLPDPGNKPGSPTLQIDFLLSEPPGNPHKGMGAKVKLSNSLSPAQSCPTLYDPMGFTVHGMLRDRTLEWVAFPFSRGSSQPRDRTHVSCIAGRFITS